MGNTFRRQTRVPTWGLIDVEYPADFPVYGAGCMFVNSTHVLAGIHNRQIGKRHPRTVVSGFGGKQEDGETWKQTAFRETIEEFFDVQLDRAVFEHQVYPRLLTLRPHAVQYTPAPRPYLTLVYSFDQLRRFLAICRPFVARLTITTYPQMYPRTEMDLVMGRKVAPVPAKGTTGAEITHILLWPRYAGHQHYWISSDLFGDLSMLNHNYLPRQIANDARRHDRSSTSEEDGKETPRPTVIISGHVPMNS